MKNIGILVRDFAKRADMYLLALSSIATIFGIVIIASATKSYQTSTYVAIQIAALLIGVALYVVFTVLDIDVLADKWLLLAAFELLFLGTLIPFGVEGDTGNKGWLRFAGIGIQPSEVVKVVFIIVMSKHISFLKEYKRLNSVLSIGQLVVHFGATFLWLYITSEDLGSAAVYLGIFAIMLLAAGVAIYWFLVAGALVALATPILWNNFLDVYQKERILAPYDPTIDPDGWGIRWQTNRSKIALASGQFTGVGYGKGVQTQTGSLTGKHTDFIFASAGEELGMIACLAILLLLTLIIIRCCTVGLRSHNTMSMLVCFGVGGTVFFQIVINVGMCLGITPVIGITLPFFSYGGSSIISLFAAVGLVSGVKYRPKPQRFQRY